jgi:hypothetical protein
VTWYAIRKVANSMLESASSACPHSSELKPRSGPEWKYQSVQTLARGRTRCSERAQPRQPVAGAETASELGPLVEATLYTGACEPVERHAARFKLYHWIFLQNAGSLARAFARHRSLCHTFVPGRPRSLPCKSLPLTA